MRRSRNVAGLPDRRNRGDSPAPTVSRDVAAKRRSLASKGYGTHARAVAESGRKKRRGRRGIAWAALAVLLSLWLPRGPGPRLFVGGPILTMDAEGRVVEALAVEDGRIAGAGSREELQAWATQRGARVVDLGGHALLPGFVDAHSHFPASGLLDPLAQLGSPPLGRVMDIEDLVATLSARAADSRRGEWIVGWGYDDTALVEGRHPTRGDLDRVSTERPVVVFHISMHVAAVNSKGLEVLGLAAALADPPGGRRRRDESGALDGVLEEEAMRPVLLATMLPSTIEGVFATRRAAASYLAAGVTTAQNGAAQREQIRGLILLSRLGLLPLRLVLWPEGDTALALLDGSFRVSGADPDWVTIGASKFVADGSIQAGTAYLREPYYEVPYSGAAGPDGRGQPRIAREKLFEIAARVHAAGGQLAIHGNGDAAIDDILDAIEAAEFAHPRDDARHVIVHAQMARDDQLDRMKELGVIPSFFELHTWYWGDRHRDRFLGPQRAARISPLRSAMQRGLRFTLHADTPVVPMEPMRMVAAAVTRRTGSGAVLGEAERIDALSALRAVTIDAAHQMFLENSIGSLEKGKFADLVILERSPLANDSGLENVRVLETFVGGRSVYRAGS